MPWVVERVSAAGGQWVMAGRSRRPRVPKLSSMKRTAKCLVACLSEATSAMPRANGRET